MTGGGGTLFVLFIVFLVLKLVHAITWSWWWVTAPLWGGAALITAVAVVAAIVGGTAFGLFELFGRRR